ncbi:MAG: asparagine--tRNA ligase [bacterium]|nr:asparagine--tRNA ligase [bacterium]
MSIKNIIKMAASDKEISVYGWVKTARTSKNILFIEINDGSSLNSLQVVINSESQCFNELNGIGTGASIKATGQLVNSPGKQKTELSASNIEIICNTDENYPLQKKRHSFEFLREIAHLRPKTNTLSAVFRVRSQLSFAINRFFQERDFIYLHSPIITASDCEGAGELFKVTSFDLQKPSLDKTGNLDFEKDFFGKETFLTVSGQLQAEIFAHSFTKTYTFGPAFRAENSNTSRHCSEFWMIEPEVAFNNLEDNYRLAEEFIKNIIHYVLEHCQTDMEFFNKWIDKNVLERLSKLSYSKFEVITYTEAISILQSSKHKFEFPVEWGNDLQSEHERYITEQVIKNPVFVIDYPKTIKPFYMRVNDDDKTVAAMDLLVPGTGEIIGGSQREERYDILLKRMKDQNLDIDTYQWYLDLRKFGSVPHSGFGLGLERLLMYITGMDNIRDVIPFPRTPKQIKF